MTAVTPGMVEAALNAHAMLDAAGCPREQWMAAALAAAEAVRPASVSMGSALDALDGALTSGPCTCDGSVTGICHPHRCLSEVGEALAEYAYQSERANP